MDEFFDGFFLLNMPFEEMGRAQKMCEMYEKNVLKQMIYIQK